MLINFKQDTKIELIWHEDTVKNVVHNADISRSVYFIKYGAPCLCKENMKLIWELNSSSYKQWKFHFHRCGTKEVIGISFLSIWCRCIQDVEIKFASAINNPSQMKMTYIFDRLFSITNFCVLKVWGALIKKLGGSILIENQN